MFSVELQPRQVELRGLEPPSSVYGSGLQPRWADQHSKHNQVCLSVNPNRDEKPATLHTLCAGVGADSPWLALRYAEPEARGAWPDRPAGIVEGALYWPQDAQRVSHGAAAMASLDNSTARKSCTASRREA
jgi:hypothetical protein